jgi:excinuclease ABC subunit C
MPSLPPTPDDATSSLTRGVEVIKAHLATLPDRPGVYRMLGVNDAVLYVGKAKALKKRVGNYIHPDRQVGRIQRMIAQTRRMEFIETHTEAEALLLEANLIKKLRPTYNVLLKDDKMYPHIMIPRDHDFPGVYKYRGARTRPAYYYGPFLSGLAVNDTMTLLHRVFQLRNCSDHYFATRKRPCLQYHIKRCTAPCVGKVTAAAYSAQVKSARDFLAGHNRAVQDNFASAMQAASSAQDYETAAQYRDKIQMLGNLLSKQTINLTGLADADVFAAVREGGQVAIQVFFFRAGQNYGNASLFPRHGDDETTETILASTLAQFYADKIAPGDVIVSHRPDDHDLLQQALSEAAGHRVTFRVPTRGVKHQVLSFALKNAREALARHQATHAAQTVLDRGLQELFGLERRPERIEVYDNSHLGGTGQIGAMIVAGPDGFKKNAYRKFNIKTAAAADDYAMMREVMGRRFRTKAGEDAAAPLADDHRQNWPDLVLIDGGLGQLHAVKESLMELGVWDDLNVVAISKGPDRNAGREWFHIDGRDPFQLPTGDPILHYLQRLRDEAHRFAIGTQRSKRQAGLTRSMLDQIPGIGIKRKKALLLHFGSAKEVAAAAIDDLMKVNGISKTYAIKIHHYFHENQ